MQVLPSSRGPGEADATAAGGWEGGSCAAAGTAPLTVPPQPAHSHPEAPFFQITPAAVLGTMLARSFDFLDEYETKPKEQLPAELVSIENATFSIPMGLEPAEFLHGAFTNEAQADVSIRFMHGTTTLGFVFNEGIIVTVDSRASMGSYIGSQTVEKCIPITPFLLGTMAGGAADCQFWERNLGKLCRLYELRNKERISVAAASKLLANILHSYRGMGLSMGTMVAGWDKTGPGLYYVDNDGLRVKNERFAVGSGSPYAYGVLDAGYRKDLTVAQACDLGRRAVFHATFRDAASGGRVSVFHVTANGWTRVSTDDVADLHTLYSAEKVGSATGATRPSPFDPEH